MPPKSKPVKVNKKAPVSESTDTTEAKTDTVNMQSTTQSSAEVPVTEYSKEYQPFIIKLPSNDERVFEYEPDPVLSKNTIDYPRFSNGFQHYIHASKNKMTILKDFENKKKVYLVINPFERYVDNYEDNIGATSQTYFGIGKDKPDILSRGFYKLWEMLILFDLVDVQEDKFVSAHLAEGPGSFIQATMFYRDKFSKKSKNDKYHAVTLHPEDTTTHVPELEKTFVKYYETEKPVRFILHKTYPKQIAGGIKTKDNGDLTDPKTIKLFGGQLDDKADFVTADGGFEWSNENTQEQEAFRLIFAQIIAALKIQKKGGNFVCKFFETFTMMSVKYISIAKYFYKEAYFYKPLMSRQSNSEKYLICKGFKFADKDPVYKKQIAKLDVILKDLHTNKQMNVIDIFSGFNPSEVLITNMIFANTYIANRQFKSINEIKIFIDSQNYYGDVYQMKRQQQINASKFWISEFFTNVGAIDIKSKHTHLEKLIKQNDKQVTLLATKLE